MKKKLRSLSLLIVTTIFISGCIFGPSVKEYDPKDPTRSLVFGYIDMENAPTKLEWLFIKQYVPKPVWNYLCSIEDGLFWHHGIPNGSHQVVSFGGSQSWPRNTRYRYSFEAGMGNPTQIRIKKPGVYFLGAYKFKVVKKSGFFSGGGGEYDLKPIKSLTEKKLLKRLLKELKDDDKKKFSRQIKMIKKRLRKLK